MPEESLSVWDHIPDSGKLERGMPFWLSSLGEKRLQSWLRLGLLSELTPEQMTASPRRIDLNDGMIEYQLERHPEGFRAQDVLRESPTKIISTSDPRAAFARFELKEYLRQLSISNNITIRPDNPETGFSGVYKVGDSKVGKQTTFSWLVALNRDWAKTPAAEGFLRASVSDRSILVLLLPRQSSIPNGFIEQHPRVVVIEMPVDSLTIDPVHYCRRDFGLSFEDVKPLFMSTKKAVVDKETSTIIVLERQLAVANSVARKHEFLIALLEHGTPQGQNAVAFAKEHLKLGGGIQDVEAMVRKWKSQLRKEFTQLFLDDPSAQELLDSSLLRTGNVVAACKIPRESIVIW